MTNTFHSGYIYNTHWLVTIRLLIYGFLYLVLRVLLHNFEWCLYYMGVIKMGIFLFWVSRKLRFRKQKEMQQCSQGMQKTNSLNKEKTNRNKRKAKKGKKLNAKNKWLVGKKYQKTFSSKGKMVLSKTCIQDDRSKIVSQIMKWKAWKKHPALSFTLVHFSVASHMFSRILWKKAVGVKSDKLAGQFTESSIPIHRRGYF